MTQILSAAISSKNVYNDSSLTEAIFSYCYRDLLTDAQARIYEKGDSVVEVAFRGTQIKVLRDLLTDIRFTPKLLLKWSWPFVVGKVHRGFYFATVKVLKARNDGTQRTLLESIKLYRKAGKKIIFTGHSLGGAMACIAGYLHPDLCESVITFGQPKTIVLRNAYPTRMIAVVNEQDPITRFNFPCSYEVPGDLWQLGAAGGDDLGLSDIAEIPDHKIENYIANIKDRGI